MNVEKRIIAITGPSNAGKTTLGKRISQEHNIVIPQHCTTRSIRADDEEGFYRYLDHETYRILAENNQFLITSGDNVIIAKEFGNYYGVLKRDCLNAFNRSNDILMYVSYKDIEQLLEINKTIFRVNILNLTFHNIYETMMYRFTNDVTKNYTKSDMEKRINCAIEYEKNYGEYIRKYSQTIFTDECNIDETYKVACKMLKL